MGDESFTPFALDFVIAVLGFGAACSFAVGLLCWIIEGAIGRQDPGLSRPTQIATGVALVVGLLVGVVWFS